MAKIENLTKKELIAKLEDLKTQLSSNTARLQLALLQEIETALARETDLDGIYEVVGDKLIEIFGAQTVAFYSVDRVAGLMYFPYTNEKGVKEISREPVPMNTLYQHVVDHGDTFVMNGNFQEYVKEFVDYQVPWGELPRSVVVVPIINTPERWASISLQDMDNDDVFSDEDIQLLETLAASMSVALKNAELFEETSQRNAELALINSVQNGLAANLDIQEIYDLVGEKIRNIFNAEAVILGSVDNEAGLQSVNYFFEKGERFYPAPRPISGFTKYIVETGKTFVANEDANEKMNEFGSVLIGEKPKSVLFVPLKTGKTVTGVISLQNFEEEHAFDENDVRLLETLASSMSVALNNARLFEETNQRNSELAVINSVQEGLASKLDMQAIYNLVGDKVSEITGSEIVVINTWDKEAGTIRYEYIQEKGERPGVIEREMTALNLEVLPQLERGETQIFNEGVAEMLERYDHSLPAGEMPLTVVNIPLKTGNRINTFISLQDTQKEFAFDKSTIRLVETLAHSMGIALENARLFEETNLRNLELAVINSVQNGLAAELDMQEIYQLVGEKISEATSAKVVLIGTMEWEEGVFRAHYARIGDQTSHGFERPLSKLHFALREGMETGNTLLLNQGIEAIYEEHSHVPGIGEIPKTIMAVPLKIGGEYSTFISLQDFENEFAFDESTVRLVETLGGNAEAALENARLFDEVQQNNQEILEALERQTATSDILHIIANSPGEIQPVLDAVAQHAARLCAADDVQIYQVVDGELPQVAHFGPLPGLKDGETLPLDRGLVTGRAILDRKTIHLDAGCLDEAEYPISAALHQRLKHRSVIATPLVTEGGSVGAIVARRNEVREFSDIEINLLSTFADQAAISIENVRLFEETNRLLAESRQQAEELKSVNTVSQALSSELELEALIDLIGSQVQQIFSADVAYVGLLDQEANTIDFPYSFGEQTRPLKLGEGLTSRVILSGKPLLINQDVDWDKTKKRIGVKAKSYLGVPIFIGKDVIGVISIQSTKWTNMYGEKDVRLLTTIAGNVGAAIKNANLFTEVERQKEYFEALISSAPVAIITIGLDGQVTGWSPAAESLFGYTEDEALGQDIDDLVANHNEVREEAELYTRKFLQEIGKIELKSRRTHKDGHLIDVAINAMPVYNEGEMSGYIAIYNDVSALEKARRDAEEANQAKSAFLANMSHELRTPLNAIIGFTRIVKRKGKDILPEKQIGNLEKVLVSAEHLLGLINTVLDISKIEAGRMDIHVSSFELKPLIELALVTSQPLIKSPEVVLESSVADGLPIVKSDLEKIKQILLNLLSNAAKFTHEGKIFVDVQQEENFIKVDVKDTGIGISPKALDTIFEEFQQADISTTREYGGTGLGLSISRSLAQLLGGDLLVQSEVGVGSTFSLTFPVELEQERVIEDMAEPVEVQKDSPLVLVIDDNEDAISLMRQSLNDAGYQVAVARNGEEGLAKARNLNPFAITLDIMMPKKDGWQVLHDLKQNPATRNIPVIMISIVDKKALGFRLGAADYLVKPLDEEAVLGSLDNLRKKNGGQKFKRLLVVDDDPNIPDMIRQLLDGSSYEIETAGDGEQAWENINRSKPDAILLDLMMPRLDGFGFLQRVSQDENLSNVPVIVLTAKLLSDGERIALKDSVQQVIQKQGLSGEDLLAEISQTIKQTL